MVNQFNENNKQIKDTNKVPKTEKEMNDLIVKNQEIQKDCQDIDDSVTEGKVFSGQIDERLNLIIDPILPEIEQKYEDKNALIDECDELFDNCEDKIKGIEAKLDELLNSVDDSLAKLDNASPITNPSSAKA
jgi:chromosome segregation ATPase